MGFEHVVAPPSASDVDQSPNTVIPSVVAASTASSITSITTGDSPIRTNNQVDAADPIEHSHIGISDTNAFGIQARDSNATKSVNNLVPKRWPSTRSKTPVASRATGFNADCHHQRIDMASMRRHRALSKPTTQCFGATNAHFRARARSLSPTRSCPRLRHTQGRLDMDVSKLAFGQDLASCCSGSWLQLSLALDECLKGSFDEEQVLLEHEVIRRLRARPRSSQDQTQTQTQSNTTARRRVLNSKTHPAKIHPKPQQQQQQQQPSPSPRQPTQPQHKQQLHQQMTAPGLLKVKRVVSSSLPAATPCPRFKIFYRDESFRNKWSQNTLELIQKAQQQVPGTDSCISSCHRTENNRLSTDSTTCKASTESENARFFALKALKYRRLWSKVERLQIDLQSSTAAREHCLMECLGVEWCKVETT